MVAELKRTNFAVAWFAFVVCIIATSMFVSSACYAQQAVKVKTAMELLKAKAEKLGPGRIEGEDTVAGKKVPGLFFGETKMNNNFALVDEVQKEVGGTATIFVKSGDEFIRIATNVRKDDGSRATGTILDPKGKAIEAIRKGEGFYGEADILGKTYMTGYEPIRSAENNIIGIYYVGYVKGQ